MLQKTQFKAPMEISKKIQKLRLDFRGYLFREISLIKIKQYQLISTFWLKILLKLKGVEFGEGCTFWGFPIIKRAPLSKIFIGVNCSFRSDRKSNLIGINRTCIIATMSEGSKIIIGDRSGLSGTVITAKNSIILGNNVLCGANTLITDFDWHPIEPVLRLERRSSINSAPIVIENNVWLGINTVVLKGVRIGENSVIGANSLVTRDIPPNVVAVGSPCKILRQIV
jgi:acetyltransferase-like isoleucine patch superfamily enzyme